MRMSSVSFVSPAAIGAVLAVVLAAGAAAQPAPGEIPRGNHYQCYPAKQREAAVPRKAFLTDQFGRQEVRVVGVTRLCNPVEKRAPPNGVGPVIDKDLHLVCYRIESNQKGRAVRVRNQFGTATLETGAAYELCLPSAKTILK